MTLSAAENRLLSTMSAGAQMIAQHAQFETLHALDPEALRKIWQGLTDEEREFILRVWPEVRAFLVERGRGLLSRLWDWIKRVI